jgi:hypothetical protein
MWRLLGAQSILAVAVAGLVCGCAGGGGGGGAPPGLPASPPAPAPPPAAFLDPPLVIPPSPAGMNPGEYAANWGVGASQAAAAWSQGFTGAGIKIGVIDDGIVAPSDPAYAELQGRIDPASKDIDATRNTLSSTLSHGSELSALIAGNKNDQKTVGVAYGATILAVRSDDGNESFNDDTLASALNYAVSQGVKVVNFSLGKSTPVSPQFAAAITNATAAGVVIVVSAGNDGASAANVNYPGFYATDPAVSHNLIMVAGGLNQDGSFNTVSNPANGALNFYLTAPGWQIIVPDFGPPGPVPGFQQCYPIPNNCTGLVEIQGTSYASPHVTGAVALLMQAFPALTPQQIVSLILNSADDMGTPGVDATFGHGRLDIAKAFQPAGAVSAPVSGAGGEIQLGQEVGVAGPAFGDAFENRANWRSVAFDSYNRTFEISLAPSWRPTSNAESGLAPAPLLWRAAGANGVRTSFALSDPAPPAAVRGPDDEPKTAFRAEAQALAGMRMAFARGVAAAPAQTAADLAGFLAFAGYDQGAAMSKTFGAGVNLSLVMQSGTASAGEIYGPSHRKAGAGRIELERGALRFGGEFGALTEDGAVLGTTWNTRWGGQPRALTRFIGLSGGWRFAPDWEFGVQSEFGATTMRGDWLELPHALTTSAAAAALRWSVTPAPLRDLAPDVFGALTVSVSQPLRVDQGAFSVLLPKADQWGRESLAFERRLIPAVPSGREVDASLAYALWAGDRFSLRAEGTYRNQPDHRADADAEAAFTFGLRYGF